MTDETDIASISSTDRAYRFCGYLLDALRELGTATPDQATEWIVKKLDLPEEMLQRRYSGSGELQIKTDVRFARLFMFQAGFIDNSLRGVWSLTEKGRNTHLDEAAAKHLVGRMREDARNSADADENNESNPEAMPVAKRYWVYAPGSHALYWEEFYQNKIMGLGWDDLGDLTEYPDRTTLNERIVGLYGGKTSGTNNTLSLWNFCNVLQNEDVVYVKNGLNKIVGRGITVHD